MNSFISGVNLSSTLKTRLSLNKYENIKLIDSKRKSTI